MRFRCRNPTARRPVYVSDELLRCIETEKPSVFVKIFAQLIICFNSWSVDGNKIAWAIVHSVVIDALVRHASHG